MCAVADDDEIAEGMAPPKPGPPPLRDWSPEVERLTLLVDQIAALIALTATAHGSKKKPPKPLPRPRTAYDRIKARRRTETADHIRELVKPAPGKPTMAEGRPDPRSQMTRKR